MKNLILPILTIALFSCQNTPKEASPEPIVEPETVISSDPNWVENATIYEANLRQMTEEGTFKAFQEQHLDRLKDMGVEIIWLMPIFPIGEKNRKGTMGSYYAVQDYQAVNPEHGTMDDFKALVSAAHEKGMKVILDWVANHTAWDNVWIADHPEWFSKDNAGNFVPPVEDWADVMDLNYENNEMREAMISSMKFWLTEADVDGFRCDVAEMVPLDFWVDARKELDKVKPIFFLAEGEKAELHDAFDMTYAWSFHHLMNDVAKGEKGATDLAAYWSAQDSLYEKGDLRMQFITNHDENSWNGTAIERMGDNRLAFAVMSFTVPGMPLIYSGQEADMDKRLEFFEKDAIDWKEFKNQEVYRKLSVLKANHPALVNGAETGSLEFLDTGNEQLVAYLRSKDSTHVLTVLNLSDKPQEVNLENASLNGMYLNWFVGSGMNLKGSLQGTIKPNGYMLMVKK